METVMCDGIFPANDNVSLGTIAKTIKDSGGKIGQIVPIVMPNGLRIYHFIWDKE